MLYLTSGYIASLSFLIFTVGGYAAQLHKLAYRTQLWRKGELNRDVVCDGLLAVREMWSFSAFFLFALSGLTRSYLDYFLVLSRSPALMLTTALLGILYYHGSRGAKVYFFVAIAADALFIILAILKSFGFMLNGPIIQWIVDGTLLIIAFLLCYFKLAQAFKMYGERRFKAVSYFREIGLVIKDLTGFWYAMQVGSELLLLAITHILSVVGSLSICGVKHYLESKEQLNHKNT